MFQKHEWKKEKVNKPINPVLLGSFIGSFPCKNKTITYSTHENYLPQFFIPPTFLNGNAPKKLRINFFFYPNYMGVVYVRNPITDKNFEHDFRCSSLVIIQKSGAAKARHTKLYAYTFLVFKLTFLRYGNFWPHVGKLFSIISRY